MTHPQILEMHTATGPQVAEAITAGAVLILPLGSLEQHGPHLPLTTDATIATSLMGFDRRCSTGMGRVGVRLVAEPLAGEHSSGLERVDS